MKNKLFAFIFMSVFFFQVVSAVLLSDQGTNVINKSTGNLLSLGNLTITIYDNPSGGNLIFNQTFSDAIINGSWNLMLSPNLEFGNTYWKDYSINGQDLDFDGNERLAFQSPLGLINNVSFINFSLINSCPAGSSIRLINKNGSVECETNNLSSVSTNLSNYALKNQSETFAGNITTTQTGFFGWLGSLASRISKLWITDINATGNIETSENVSAKYFKGDGSLLTNLPAGVNNATFNQSLTDSLYGSKIWAYNQTYSGSTYNSTYSPFAYNQTYSGSTFNFTYSLFAYNQTYSGSTFNSTYAASVSNNSWNQTFASTLYAGIQWNYNQTYSGSTYNSTYASNVNNATFNQSLTDGLYCAIKFGYNQTYSGSTFNSTYASSMSNASFNQSLTDTLYANANASTFRNLTITNNITISSDKCPVGQFLTTDLITGDVSCMPLRTFVKLDADISTANATNFFNQTLVMSVAANLNYTFDCELIVLSAVATTGIQLNLTVPASPTYISAGFINPTSATATLYSGCSGNAVGACNSLGTASLTTALPIKISGRLINGANAGVINITLRSEVQSSAVTVKRESYCYATVEP